MDIDVLVPSLLVFGTLPNFPTFNKYISEQRERLIILDTLRNELANLRAEQRITTVFKSNILSSTMYKLRKGHDVGIYSENEKRCVKGRTVIEVEDKQSWINIGNRLIERDKLQIFPSIKDGSKRDIMVVLDSLKKSPAGGQPKFDSFLKNINFSLFFTPRGKEKNLPQNQLCTFYTPRRCENKS